jgi:hypothetical protein
VAPVISATASDIVWDRGVMGRHAPSQPHDALTLRITVAAEPGREANEYSSLW